MGVAGCLMVTGPCCCFFPFFIPLPSHILFTLPFPAPALLCLSLSCVHCTSVSRAFYLTPPPLLLRCHAFRVFHYVALVCLCWQHFEKRLRPPCFLLSFFIFKAGKNAFQLLNVWSHLVHKVHAAAQFHFVKSLIHMKIRSFATRPFQISFMCQ